MSLYNIPYTTLSILSNMHGTYEQNKASVARWKEKNREKYLTVARNHMRQVNIWKKAKLEFLAILL